MGGSDGRSKIIYANIFFQLVIFHFHELSGIFIVLDSLQALSLLFLISLSCFLFLSLFSSPLRLLLSVLHALSYPVVLLF